MRLLTRISDEACVELFTRAKAVLNGVQVDVLRDARAEIEQANLREDRVVLVHDLMPRPAAQLEWLQRLHGRFPTLSFFLLLPPSGATVRELALRGSRLPVVGVELWTPELSAVGLARTLRNALDWRARDLELWARVSHWSFPPDVRFFAEAALRFASKDAALKSVLDLADVKYESTRRQAARSGLPPPGEFVEALRLLRAVSLLEQGERVKDVATTCGFRNADRFGRRMRRHFDVTPTQARKLGALALLDRLERDWFGDVVAR